MIVVSDTSPISALMQVGRCCLLKERYREVLIPEAVRKELMRAHSPLPEFLCCVPGVDWKEVPRFECELDLGGAEAIVLARERRADVVLIDELEGRRVAAREGVPFIGLLGGLVQAKRHVLLPSAN